MPGSPVQNELLSKMRAVCISLIQYGQARLELLSCEWAEERLRIGDLLFHGLLVLLMLFSTLEFGALLVVAWLWDTVWRIPSIAAIAGLSLIATIALSVTYSQRRAHPTLLFESSADECRKDRQPFERRQ